MEIKEEIKNIIKDNEVCLFMKGTPEAPQCGFSMAVSNILKHLQVDFKGINVLENESLRQNALETGSWLKDKLEALKETFPLIGDVRGEGFFLGVELIIDPETREPAPLQAGYVVERMKSRKILLSTEGPGHNVLKFKPPMVFNQRDAEHFLAELEQVLCESPLQ